MPNSLKCRLKGLVRKGLLSEKDLSRIYTDNDVLEELENIKDEIGNEFVDLQDGSEEWRSYVNDTVLSCYEIIEKHISNLKGEDK